MRQRRLRGEVDMPLLLDVVGVQDPSFAVQLETIHVATSIVGRETRGGESHTRACAVHRSVTTRPSEG